MKRLRLKKFSKIEWESELGFVIWMRVELNRIILKWYYAVWNKDVLGVFEHGDWGTQYSVTGRWIVAHQWLHSPQAGSCRECHQIRYHQGISWPWSHLPASQMQLLEQGDKKGKKVGGLRALSFMLSKSSPIGKLRSNTSPQDARLPYFSQNPWCQLSMKSQTSHQNMRTYLTQTQAWSPRREWA